MYSRMMVLIFVLGLLAASSCSGGMNSSASELNSSLSWQGSAGHAVEQDQPVLPKDASRLVVDPYQGVGEGKNNIDLSNYKAFGGDVNYDIHKIGPDELLPGGGSFPVNGYALQLNSTPAHMAFATFALSGITGSDQISNIVINGYSPGVKKGLYVGLSNYGAGSYRWYGPYKLDAVNPVQINMGHMSNADSAGNSYITLACYGGDSVTVSGMSIWVNPWFPLPNF